MNLQLKVTCVLVFVGFYLIFAICVMSRAFWYNSDKKVRLEIRKFKKINIRINLFIGIATLILKILGLDEDIFLLFLLSECIIFGNVIQNLYELKAEECNEKVTEDMIKLAQEDNHLRNAERIIVYCREQIEILRKKSYPDEQKLVYEKMKDYLKYYKCADDFFDIYKNYTKGDKTLNEVDEELDKLLDFLKYDATELVKIPE